MMSAPLGRFSVKPGHKRAIAAAFNRAVDTYDVAALLQQQTGERLLRSGLHHTGNRVLDAGCGTGYFSRRWHAMGKKVSALDLAQGMLACARRHNSADHYVLGDIEQLPFSAASFDICFSNLVLQWCELSVALAQLYRVTRPGGLILFSTLAQGSLSTLGDAWQQVDGQRHVNEFLSMAQIKKACRYYQTQLAMQSCQQLFPDIISLMRSLKNIGATHRYQAHSAGLTGRRQLSHLASAHVCERGYYPLTYQLVYGVIHRD